MNNVSFFTLTNELYRLMDEKIPLGLDLSISGIDMWWFEYRHDVIDEALNNYGLPSLKAAIEQQIKDEPFPPFNFSYYELRSRMLNYSNARLQHIKSLRGGYDKSATDNQFYRHVRLLDEEYAGQ